MTSVIAQTPEFFDVSLGHAVANRVLNLSSRWKQSPDFLEHKVDVPDGSVLPPVTINVHLHVIHQNETVEGGNIPDSRLIDQTRLLNEGFVDANISFNFAATTRTQKSEWFNLNATDYDSGPQKEMKKALRTGGAADLNVYTVGSIKVDGINGTLLGYSSYHFEYLGDPKNDGIVIRTSILPGGSFEGYNLGKSLIHEVGHWVGLYHTFEGGCHSPGDSVLDTPAEASPARGCPTGRDSCNPEDGQKDPIHNFMDYTNNTCTTDGQVLRLRSQIATYRGII